MGKLNQTTKYRLIINLFTGEVECVRRTRIRIRHWQFTEKDISLKSQGITRKRPEKLVSLYRSSLNLIRSCASGCGNPRNGAAVSMAGLFLPPLRTPGCQVDHTLKWQPRWQRPLLSIFWWRLAVSVLLRDCSAALFKVNFVMWWMRLSARGTVKTKNSVMGGFSVSGVNC